MNRIAAMAATLPQLPSAGVHTVGARTGTRLGKKKDSMGGTVCRCVPQARALWKTRRPWNAWRPRVRHRGETHRPITA